MTRICLRIKLLFILCVLSEIHILVDCSLTMQGVQQKSNDLSYELLQASSFSESKYRNFTLFTVLHLKNEPSIFAVSDGNTVVEIGVESMKLLSNHTYRSCPLNAESSCDEKIVINQISDLTLLGHKMLWLCYTISRNDAASPTQTNCLVPTNNILNTDLKWQKIGYTSNDINFQTFSVQTKDYIFIGSYVDNALRIQRTHLPDISGRIDDSSDLETPVAEFYFEKNSKFLTAFQTDFEVYFVVVEPVSAKRNSVSECFMSSDNRILYMTRLIRICKKETGGVSGHNENNFGTVAKANLLCPMGVGKDQFLYMRAESASWANSKLYVIFENQKNSPPGKVLCYFDQFAFNKAFNGPMRPPWIIPNSPKQDKIKNPLPDVCEKVEKGLLNEVQLTVAASLSVNGLYRDLDIFPVSEKPLMTFHAKNIANLHAIETKNDDFSTILASVHNHQIELYSHNADMEMCRIGSYNLNLDELVNQISGSIIDSSTVIFISTNKRVIKLKIICEIYKSKKSCLSESPNICGWDSRTLTCSSLNDDVDVKSWKRSSCNKEMFQSEWTASEICTVQKSQSYVNCVCNYCRDEVMCRNKPKIKITSCAVTPRVEEWSDWGMWSECSAETRLRKRHRTCLSYVPCKDNREEIQICEDKLVAHSSWTQWFGSSNANVYKSFRSKCVTDQQTLTSSLETRESFCGKSCSENMMTWSKWSDCTSLMVQFRFLNCSSFSDCSPDRINVQNCDLNPKKLSYQKSTKDESYSTIHLILVVLVSSIVWVFILIIISIILLRCKFKTQNFETTPKRRKSSKRNQFYLRREISETSNDYLSSEKSTYCDTDYLSFIHNDNIPSTSKNVYYPYPLISENPNPGAV